MTMPSIADVKAAADTVMRNMPAYSFRESKTLAEFAQLVLSAPGMSEERLAEIQRKEQAATKGPWLNTCGIIHAPATKTESALTLSVIDTVDGDFISEARDAVPELLAEVLRLRTENAVLKGSWSAQLPPGPELSPDVNVPFRDCKEGPLTINPKLVYPVSRSMEKPQ